MGPGSNPASKHMEMTMTFDLFNHFAVAEDKETQGVWISPISDEEGAPKFKLARTGGGNKAYTIAAGKAMKPYGPSIQKGAQNLDPATLDIIKGLNFKVFIDHALKDWKNVTSKGEEIPFSKEAATKLLTELPELYEKLFTEASDISNYRPDDRADLGN